MIGRAGGTGRYINPFVLQRMEKYLAADALKAGADDLRRVGAVLTAVDGDAAERFQSRNQVLPECIQLFDACIKIFVRLACCHAESDTPPTFSVPERMPFCCPPPNRIGRILTPSRI